MTNLPIACTLGPAALKARREDLLGGLVRRAEERLDAPGMRMTNLPITCTLGPAALKARREGPIWLEFTGPPGSKEFLAGMLDL